MRVLREGSLLNDRKFIADILWWRFGPDYAMRQWEQARYFREWAKDPKNLEQIAEDVDTKATKTLQKLIFSSASPTLLDRLSLATLKWKVRHSRTRVTGVGTLWNRKNPNCMWRKAIQYVWRTGRMHLDRQHATSRKQAEEWATATAKSPAEKARLMQEWRYAEQVHGSQGVIRFVPSPKKIFAPFAKVHSSRQTEVVQWTPRQTNSTWMETPWARKVWGKSYTSRSPQ